MESKNDIFNDYMKSDFINSDNNMEIEQITEKQFNILKVIILKIGKIYRCIFFFEPSLIVL